MHTLEAILERFIRESDNLKKFLVYSLLCFIPVLNIFSFGYLYRLSQNLNFEDGTFPTSDNYIKLFIEGLVFLSILIVFVGVPLFFAFLLKAILLAITGNLLGILAFIPISLVWLVAPSVFVIALSRYQKHRTIRCLLDIRIILLSLLSIWKKALVAVLFVTGFSTILLPLYGFSFVLGYAFLVYYFAIILKNADSNL